jgi:hypothetical protein
MPQFFVRNLAANYALRTQRNAECAPKKFSAAAIYSSLSDLLLFSVSWHLDASLSRYRGCKTPLSR